MFKHAAVCSVFLSAIFCWQLPLAVAQQSSKPGTGDSQQKVDAAQTVTQAIIDARDELRALAKPFSQTKYTLSVVDFGKQGLTLSNIDSLSTDQFPDQLIIVAAGFQSTNEATKTFATSLNDHIDRKSHAKYRIAIFEYPNDGSIERSGNALYHMLRAIAEKSPTTRVSIVAHSMGGLVGRWAIESKKDATVSNVDRLIMIFTPNHGATIAKYADAMEFADAANRICGSETTFAETMLALVNDGLGEACEELVPDSEFLKRLNASGLNAKVRYSIFAGTEAPLTPIMHTVVQSTTRMGIDRAKQNDKPILVKTLERVEELVSNNEFTNGLGDGVVSTSSARLPGVKDFNKVPIRHIDWAETSNPKVDDLVESIAVKLRETK